MASSKKCFKCEQTKQISEFYKHPMMGDGHLGKCKDCTRKDAGIHRRKNLEKIRAYDNSRAGLPHRRSLRKKITWRRRKAVKFYDKAHNALVRAVKLGRIKRMPCQMCGTTEWVAGHHDDYTKPLQVMWLCPQHHAARHSYLSYMGF